MDEKTVVTQSIVDKVDVPQQIKKTEPLKITTPPKPSVPLPRTVISYKMNIYRSNGQLRPDISKAVFLEMSRRWGDIMRVISNNRFQTIDEICETVWAAERRIFNRGHDRTRKQIEECISDLIAADFVLVREVH